MTTETQETVKCLICGRFYKVYALYCGDQSCCPKCREAKKRAVDAADTNEQIKRRHHFFGA